MALRGMLPLGLRATAIACAIIVGLAAALPSVANARQDTRTLKLHFTHTGERGIFTFRRNGQYDRKELARINNILRDWRRNEPARMDPMLLDLIWEIYRRTGSSDYIHIISAYRSPATNEMLRKRSSGVAKQSQHTRGKAMDFFIPGVPLSKLRAIALTVQGGGVGYYPSSGSPFVHVDTGSVRHWPRMTRKQLVALFPKGETLHVPSDGKPLPGYERAVAKRKSGESIAVASADSRGGGNVAGWLNRVFGGGSDESEDDAMAGRPPAAAPQPTVVADASDSRALEPPAAVPLPRPVAGVEVALVADGEQADVPSPPLPKAVPNKTRLILMAARERAQLAELANTAVEPPLAPVDFPETRPAAPTAVAALGDRAAGSAGEIDATSADAALAGLYAAAAGGNPEVGTTAAIAGQSRPARAGAANPASAMAAVDALGMSGIGNRETASTLPKVELAYAPADLIGEAGGPAATQSGGALPTQADPGAGSSDRRAGVKTARSGPQPQAQLLAVRLDAPLLQRLMSRETTRTAGFVTLAQPQPRRDLFLVPVGGGEALTMAGQGQLRTDRFQAR